MKITRVGDGKVYLIAGGGKIYADIAARFVRSERPVTEIIDSPYSSSIINNLLASNHFAALEFDYFIFGVEGFSRVCEAQLIRKRHASYLIKSGRQELNGKREFSVVLPESIRNLLMRETSSLNTENLISMLETWYEHGLAQGIPEEDLRYLKPQATEFRGIIGMNAHALYDFFAVRCCKNAQAEIRDMASKMLKTCKEFAPDLFANAGPNCVRLGYCPENRLQNKVCKGKVQTKEEALQILANHRAQNTEMLGVISA